MAWWRAKVVAPLRRAWLAVAARARPRKDEISYRLNTGAPGECGADGGILKLHEDVQTCGYQDVQVMWNMLRPEPQPYDAPKQRKRSFWSLSSWSVRSPHAAQ